MATAGAVGETVRADGKVERGVMTERARTSAIRERAEAIMFS